MDEFLFEYNFHKSQQRVSSALAMSLPLVTSFRLEKRKKEKKPYFSAIAAGLLKPPFNKGSLTRLVAIVQTGSMFP